MGASVLAYQNLRHWDDEIGAEPGILSTLAAGVGHIESVARAATELQDGSWSKSFLKMVAV
jgi:hypothetical protein